MTLKTRSLLASTALAMTLSTSVFADEFRIDRMYVVGDSLSDGGAYETAGSLGFSANTGMASPTATNPDFRFRFMNDAADGSNGVYAEVLADQLGIGLEPYTITTPGATSLPTTGTIGGTNYAQGGSRVSQQPGFKQNIPAGISTIPVSQQVDQMLMDRPQFNSNDLVVLWAGNNDVLAQYFGGGGSSTAALPAPLVDILKANMVTAADDMTAQVNRVLAAGATNVVVVEVPDIGGNTPLGASQIPSGGNTVLTSLVDTFNDRLVQGVGGRVTVVNSNAILDDVLNNPTRYGFSGINQRQAFACTTLDSTGSVTALPCVAGVTTQADGQNGNSFVFADSVHPTAATHNIFGQMSAATLVAVGQVGVMPVATISGLRQQSLGLEQRLNLGAFFINDENGNRIRRPVGNVEVYGGGELGFYESDPQQVVPGFDAATQVVKVAADVMVAPDVMVGLGGSIDHAQVEFDENRGGFDSRLYVGGVFGVAQIIPGVYANTFVGGGLIDIYDIERGFDLKDLNGNQVARESYEADTDGTYFIARANLGGVLPVGNGFFVNPSVGFAYERVDIDGYGETAQNGSSTALQGRYDDLEYEGYRGTVALGGFYRPPSAPTWTFGLRASWEHDFNDDDIVVRHANADSPLAASNAPRPDDSYGLIAATVVKELTHSTSMSLQGSTNFAQDGVTGYTASLVFKHSF